MSVAEAQAKIDSYEFAEWIQDYCLQSWEQGDDHRTALLAAVITNSNPYRSGPAAKIEDFLPKPRGATFMGREQLKAMVQQMKADAQRAEAKAVKKG